MRVFSFVLLLLLVAAPSRSRVADCDQLYARTETVRDAIRAEIRQRGQIRPATLRAFATAAQAARACYAGQEPERGVRLFQRELYALNELGHHAHALALVDTFFVEAATASSAADRVYVLRQKADALSGMGRPVDAVQALQQALQQTDALSVKARTALHREVAARHQHLADFAAARDHLGRAERLFAESGLQDDQQLARLLGDQSELAVTEADHTGIRDTTVLLHAAEQAHRSAVLHAAGGRVVAAAIAYVKALEALAYAGQPEAALAPLAEAQRLVDASDHPVAQMAVSYKGGRLHLQRRAFDEAEPMLMRARELAERENHVDYLRRITYDVGLLHELTGAPEEAADWYRRSMRLTEEYRASLRASEWAAHTFADWQPPYRGLVRVLLEQGEPEEAFVELERTRARQLLDMRRAHLLASATTDAGRVQLDSLFSALEAVRDDLRPLDPLDPRRLSFEVRETTIQLRINRLLGMENIIPSFSLDSLRASLRRDDRVLISYLIDRPNPVMPRRPSSLAFVLTADTLRAVPLDTRAASLYRMIERVSPALLQKAQPLTLDDVQFNLEALHALHDTLFAPLTPYLEPGQRLTIIPDRDLFAVPFAMLVEQEDGPYSYASAHYVAERHPISLEVSVALSEQRRAHVDEALDVAAFGRSDFGAIRDDSLSGTLRSPAGLTLRSNGAFDLPLVRDELQALGNLFASVHLALDEEATEHDFYEMAGQAKVLHVATHATTDTRSPLYNAFFLSTASDDDGEDGLVHLYELQRRNLDPSLVVLSGCNTGRGTLYLGEGMQGLQYGFMAAGALSVMAHTWFVEDEASLMLVRSFYRHLREGQPKDVALQQAQLDYLRDAPVGALSPFFWASPVLYGDAAALDLEPAPASPVWWMALLAVVILVGGILYRRRAPRS